MKKLTPETVKRRLRELYAEQIQMPNRVRQIQLRCPHEWRFVPDPSGNSDSGYVCEICGLWRRKI